MATSPILDVSNVVFPNETNGTGQNRTAESIKQIGDLAVETGTQYLEDSLEGDLTDATDQAVLDQAAKNQAANQPLSSDVIASILGDTSAQGASKVDADESMRPFLEKLAKSKQAASQGAIDGTELKIRHEQILREYISRHPRLAGKFVQAAGSTLGYNPIGSELDALMGVGEKNKDGTPRDPRSYIEKQYDALADELNISPTEKYTDPINWYRMVEREASFKQKLDSDTRSFQRKQLTDQNDEFDTKEQMREIAPNKARDLLGQVRGFIDGLPTQSNGQTEGVASGSLQAAKDSILAGKQAFVQQLVELSHGRFGADYVTQNYGHVLAYFDYAAQQADPKKAMDDVNRMLEAQVANGLYLRFPNFKTQEAIIKMVGAIPDDSPLGASLRSQLSSQVWASMANQMGAAWNATLNETGTEIPSPQVPPAEQTLVPPPISQRQQGPATTRIQQETIRGMRTVLGNGLASPSGSEARRVATVGAIRTVASAANEYLNTKDRRAPAKSVVWEWTSLAASDEFYKALSEPGISRVDKGLMTKPIDDALTSETLELFRNVSTSMNETVHTQDYKGFMMGYGRGDQQYPAGNFIQLQWSKGHAVFVPAESNNVRVKESGVKTNQVTKIATDLNTKFSEQLTALVRAKAHISGTNDYSHSTSDAAQLLNNVYISGE